MMLLLEILAVAIAALLVARFAQAPWRSRGLDLLKLWVTIRVFWLLLAHPVKLQDGTQVVAARLVMDTLAGLDARTFFLFCALAATTKFVGILASMLRWQILLRGQGIELPFRHIFGSFLIGRFIGTFLPSTAGLDGYKLYDAARFSGRSVEVTATTILEKVIGFSGIFLSFLVALPFGIRLFGARASLIAGVTVPFCLGLIGALLALLWYPGLIQWLLENLPIPGKARLAGIVMRISHAAAAYRDKKLLLLEAIVLSFVVHFTTAAMYWFTALAIGATQAHFWSTVLGSSIQILATVLSPFTIAGEGIREAAQYMVLGHVLGPANAIVSAALGFWAAEALTLGGAYFWWFRPRNYTPAYCLVDGVQVDYAEAARAAAQLETDEERARRAATPVGAALPLRERLRLSSGLGFGIGVLAGVVLGVAEAVVIAQGGLGADAQVLWYGPLTSAILLGAAGFGAGAALAILPMDEEEIRGWTPSLVLLGVFLPLALFIAFFRLRRDVYMEQMPPLPVLAALLGGAAAFALLLFFAGPRLFRRLESGIRPACALIVLAAVALAGAASARFIATPPAPRELPASIPTALAERPNVILVMVDTLRADHLSCFGGAQPTPALCSLADGGGARFEGFSHASWTKPATASLLTSTLPSSHGVMSKQAALSPEALLISEVFSAQHYATGGIVSNVNLSPSFGFDQGYDEYHYLGPDYLFGATDSSSKLITYQLSRRVYFKLVPGLRVGDFYQDAETVNGVAFDFLERHRNARFFLFLHYMDPHDPYFEHPYDGKGIARVGNQDPDPSQTAEMHRLYRGEIQYLDGQFAKLLAKIRELGLWDDTLIALVADHGEEFYEHGGFWHGTTLYDEQIHVPVLFKWSRHEAGAPRGDGALVRIMDVAPTLIARSGAAVPPSMQGIDLARGLAGRSAPERMVFSEEDHEGNVLRAVRTEEWKWIEANPGNPRGLPEHSLFHVARDPAEKEDLHEQDRQVADELRTHADAQQRLARTHALAGGKEAKLSDAELQALKDLGYVRE
jgi:arylsulfatase A-like enzyme/uncharacterized membrane protein YbhN (UPF0104 family)